MNKQSEVIAVAMDQGGHRKDFLPFGGPLIGEDEISEVVDTLRSGWLGTGPKVKKFESDFGGYIGIKNAVALNSCTAGLHLALLALKLEPGDEVITTPLTFCATVNAIIHAGCVPVLADISLDTLNIDPNEIRKKITSKTKVILPVHFAGRPCDMLEIMSIAREHNLFVIEDCAHAIESSINGCKTGTFGDVGCYSFYVTKNIVTGEGGMVVSANERLIDDMRTKSLHGMSHDAWKRFSSAGYRHYEVMEAGFKYNMMDIQAAIGIHQLSKIDAFHARRQRVWSTYNQNFSNLPITTPPSVPNNMQHAFHLYTILVDANVSGITRDEFLNKMQEKKIGVGVHYLAIPEFEFYSKRYNWNLSDYPVAVGVGRSIVSLPISARLTDEDVGDVVRSVSSIFCS